jgi:choline dehydrogenase
LVGQNLQEHAGIAFSKLVDVPTYNGPFGPMTLGGNPLRWLLTKRGPMASAAVHAMAGVKSSPELDEPDISLSFIPLAINLSHGKPRMHHKPGITIGGNSMRPDSRGEIRLRDADPRSKPVIDHRLLGDERDVRRLVAVGKLLALLFQAEPLRGHVVGTNYPETIPPMTRNGMHMSAPQPRSATIPSERAAWAPMIRWSIRRLRCVALVGCAWSMPR